MARSAPAYSFPILDVAEIHSCLHELQIDVSIDDLKRPQAATVHRIYTSLIIHCTGTTAEELTQPSAAGLADLENYAMHEDAVAVLTFLRALSDLLERSGVTVLTLNDIASPEPRRLVRNLSAIINFAKYREERVGVFTDMTRKTEELKEDLLQAEAECDEVQREYDALVAKQAAEKPAKDAIIEDCTRLESEIDTLNKRQAVLKHEGAECKASITGARDKLASLQFEILGCEETVKKLESQIVNSPDRLRAELKARAEQLETEREAVDQVDRARREMQSRLDSVASAKTDIDGVCDYLSGVKGEYAKYKDVVREVKSKKMAIEDCEGVIGTMEAQKKHLERLIAKLEDRIAAFRPEAEFEMNASRTALQESRAELEGLKADLKAARASHGAAGSRKAEIAEKLAQENARHAAEMAEMEKSFKELRASVGCYHRNLLGSITNTSRRETLETA